jgi:hypothetical protein
MILLYRHIFTVFHLPVTRIKKKKEVAELLFAGTDQSEQGRRQPLFKVATCFHKNNVKSNRYFFWGDEPDFQLMFYYVT